MTLATTFHPDHVVYDIRQGAVIAIAREAGEHKRVVIGHRSGLPSDKVCRQMLQATLTAHAHKETPHG